MKHSNIRDRCDVEAVTHKHDLLADASLGRGLFVSLITSAHIAQSIPGKPPNILHLKLPLLVLDNQI